jgi:site-specific recombinase XerD
LETVGKMLGHKSIKSTQRYARVTRNKINNNMNELKAKLVPIMQQAKTGS